MMSSYDDEFRPMSQPSAARVGADLRGARERLGWTLPAIAAHLRIRLPFLEAIEDGRTADLPGNAYAIGFLRTYSQALGLDPDEITRRFRAEAAEANRKTELKFPAPVPERGIPAGAIVLVGGLIAIGAYIGWYRMSGNSHPAPQMVQTVPERLAPLADKGVTVAPPAAPAGGDARVADTAAPPRLAAPLVPSSPSSAQAMTTLPPAVSSPAVSSPGVSSPGGGAGAAPVPAASLAATSSAATQAPVAKPAASVPPVAVVAGAVPPLTPPPGVAAPSGPRILLRAKSDAWIQVREKGGAVLVNRVLRAGESWQVPAKPNLLLTTGNAAGTELVVDGVAAPSLGGDGAVRRDLPLDAEAIKGGKLAPIKHP